VIRQVDSLLALAAEQRSYLLAAGLQAGGQLRPAKQEEIEQFIDRYCGERHPDSDLWRAVDDLIRQLGGSRPIPTPRAKEYR